MTALFVLLFALMYGLTVESIHLLKVGLQLNPIHSIWTSTGLCPPDPHQKAYNYLNSDSMTQNLQLIGSLPYQPYVFQVRIHWLLNLVRIEHWLYEQPKYDFKQLDSLVNTIETNNLRLGFELMGNPSNYFNDFENKTQLNQWYKLVHQVVRRYEKYAKLWNFESWNEPDHKDFDKLNFTEKGYLNYFDACEKGVHSASDNIAFGGPGASCRLTKFSKLCWALLNHVTRGKNYFTGKKGTRIDFISFHKKGGKRGRPGNSSYILQSEIETIRRINSDYTELAHIPIYNDEGDPVTGWDEPMDFRADSRYPAMVAKLIHMHLYAKDSELRNQRYLMTSNDNAFLSYYPHYFTQRTMFAHFRINQTNSSSYNVLIQKPIFTVISLLSEMKGTLTSNSLNFSANYLGAITTVTPHQATVLIWASNDTEPYSSKPFIVKLLPSDWGKYDFYIVRRLNDKHTTYKLWREMGQPVNLTLQQTEKLWMVNNIQSTSPKPMFYRPLVIHLTPPELVQVVMYRTDDSELSAPTRLKFYRIAAGMVTLLWYQDKPVECLNTYEVEFTPSLNITYVKINVGDLLTRSFQYASTRGVSGYYRIRAVDISGKSSAYSPAQKYVDVQS